MIDYFSADPVKGVIFLEFGVRKSLKLKILALETKKNVHKPN